MRRVLRLLHYLPTRRLAAAVALVAPLWLLSGTEWGSWLAGVVTMALVGVALREALSLPGARDMEVALFLPPSVGIGDVVRGEYRVATHWPGGARFRLYDALPHGLERLASDAPNAAPSPVAQSPWEAAPVAGGVGELVSIPAEGEAAVPFLATGRARGSWPFRPVVLRVEGRLGLVQRSLRFPRWDPDPEHPGVVRVFPDEREATSATAADATVAVAAPGMVTVTPSLAGVRRFRLLTLERRLRDAGVRALRRRGEGTNFAGLREYALGDDPRHIDWKASARRQKLISREYAVEQGQSVVIAVDAGRLMTQLAGDMPRFEYALSSALVLADVAVSSGDFVGLLVFDDVVRAWVPPARGRAALQRVRDALIPVQATMAEPDYALAFRTLAARHRKRSLIVLFTDVIDPRASQALIALTARSAARHLPIVVALGNDRLAAAAVPAPRASSAALYESVAAEELLSAREEALGRMRQAGVSVLDVSPQRMTAAVINRYLEVKARSAL